MADLARYHWLLLLLAAPCVGSFLSVLVRRLPEERPVVWARSACPDCRHALGPRDLVPLVSFALGGGACRHCGTRVPVFYPAIELAALGIAVWSLLVVPGWLAWPTAALGWTLLALALIDARHLVLPDELTLPLIPAGLALAWALDADKLPAHLIGAVAGFTLVVVLRAAYGWLRGREGIGLGDAKLLAGAGAWLGWEALPGVVLLSAAAALGWHLVRALGGSAQRLDRELPFGPFIAAGFWLAWLYGPLLAA